MNPKHLNMVVIMTDQQRADVSAGEGMLTGRYPGAATS